MAVRVIALDYNVLQEGILMMTRKRMDVLLKNVLGHAMFTGRPSSCVE